MPTPKERPEIAPAAPRKSRRPRLLRWLAILPLAGCACVAFVLCLPFTLIDAVRNRLRANGQTSE